MHSIKEYFVLNPEMKNMSKAYDYIDEVMQDGDMVFGGDCHVALRMMKEESVDKATKILKEKYNFTEEQIEEFTKLMYE